MDPSRGDSRYNLNYSMSSIGLSLADQADMYGNPAVAALGGRPPSTGILQSMGGGVVGSNVGIVSRSSNLMSNPSQCQSVGNNSSPHSSGQQRGVKRSGSDCYDEPRISNTGGSSLSNMQGIDNCAGNSNMSHGGQQQQQHGVNVNATDNVDDTYNAIHSKKSPPANGKKTKGRVKIKMEYIDNKLRRYTTFSKRKTGIMKKAYELSTLTGTQVMLLVASETGHVYTFATRKLQPMITSEAGKQLIQTCLNSPDPPSIGGGDQRMSATGFEETELSYNIVDEDSKEARSPMSSANDSDESSDIEGMDIASCDATTDKVNSFVTVDKTKSNDIGGNCEQLRVEPKTQKDSNIAKRSVGSKIKLAHPKDDIIFQSSTPPNVTHDVLLQLIEAGHLQVHTEDDGSGHQYVAIPLSPTAAELIQSNKLTTSAVLPSNERGAQNNRSKADSNIMDIKQELE